MNKSLAEKYNIILIILLFVIPLLAINFSYIFISKINYEWAKKKQDSIAQQEAETLSSEADFNNEFSKSFKNFFEILKSDRITGTNNSAFLTNYLNQTADNIFSAPFPDYKLYVFKIPSKSNQTDLIFYKDNNIRGKKILCLAFEHLYRLNVFGEKDNKLRQTEPSAKALMGDHTDFKILAKEIRATPTFINGMHKYSWFIWDYTINGNQDVYGAILISNEIINYNEKSQLYALKRLKSRGQALGAFIPVYKNYGEPIYQSPLDKSKTFKEWANSLTIQEEKDTEKWLKKPLPQNIQLGKYTAYTHLGRGATHIAVVLFKRLKPIIMEKWLISVNIILGLSLALILNIGIAFGKWPQISLRSRFTLSYLLATVLPLSLLGVISYGYLLQYTKTAINDASTELQTALKSIDVQKQTIIKEYKTTFAKAIKDETFINLIKEEGILSKKVSDRIVGIFEDKNKDKYLPLLGVKIIDENGEGAFSRGREPTEIDALLIINSFLSAQVNILREQLANDNNQKFIRYKPQNDNNDLANKGYKAILGRDLFEDLNRHLAVPIKRKNGEFCCYQLFDLIMIDGKPKYMLFIVWDDNALDKKLIQNTFNIFTLKNLEHNYLAYKSKGKDIGFFDKNGLMSSHKIDKQLNDYVEFATIGNKSKIYENDKRITVVKPSFYYNNTIFVGWIDKFNILLSVLKRRIVFFILAFISILILLISSLRSSAIFLKPVSILKNALDEVSLGNLDIALENAPKDELGLLSNEFSKMIEDLREKERLSKLISDQAVQAIRKENNGLLNDTETFNGVALVSDIRNFTGMSEKYDPTLITDLLNEHFAEMTKIISDNGGHIYKFIGDAIEAVFPENAELEKSASERAFIAGCMMISKLAVINKRRANKELFTYRIGVGLCYGTMYSGSVGSLETRLDYAILGEPLKKAAKFEALSIQNPSFPLIIDEPIAERIANKGYCLKKIDISSPSIYTLDQTDFSNNNNSIIIKERRIDEVKNRLESDKNIKLFSFSSSKITEKQRFSVLVSFLLVFLIILITAGLKFVNLTINDNLKEESKKECVRLSELLQSEDILKSAFETLCFEFYDDLDKSFNNNLEDLPFKQKIEKIASKYEKIGCPIPYYFCCKYESEDKELSENDYCTKGFSKNTNENMKEYASAVNMFRGEQDEAENNKRLRNRLLRKFMGNDAKELNMRSSHYRRAAIAMIEKEFMFIDTNKIIDIEQKKLLGYAICGMPRNLPVEKRTNYYTLLSGKTILLAIKNNDGWYFSNNFPEKEKQFLKETNDLKQIELNGYFSEQIKIDNNECRIYAIKKDLVDNNNSLFNNYYFYLFSILLIIITLWIINNKIDFSNPSISAKLRTDILISSVLPIITLVFLSYLFINENYNVEKAETRNKLNKLIDDIEEKEYYFNPLCKNMLDNYAFSDKLKENARIANNDDSQKEKIVNRIKQEIKNICKNGEELLISKINPHFNIREIDIIGKNDWVAGTVSRAWQSNYDKKNNLSDFGKILIEITKTVYFKNNSKKSHLSGSETKKEIMVEQILKALNSIFGNMFTIKIVNFPNNLITVTSQYTTVGLYIAAVYSDKDPDEIEYVIFALIYFDNEFKPSICNLRNDNVPFKDYIASGSVGEELYCFYSPNLYVGDYFFYTPESETKKNNYINKREDHKTLKVLGLAASWINSSYLPVSKNVDLYGKYLIEARQGNIITENVYAAITSEYSIREKAYSRLPEFGLGIFFSILLIYFIAQIVINDLLLPVQRLIEGAKSVEKGEYKFRTDFYRGDELGALCNTFDKMMKGLEEKQLMNRMVSKTALRFTSDYSDNISKKVDVVLLYVAVPNFDEFMKKYTSYELFSKLRKQIALISEIIINAGGDVDKIMGEKLLIAFHLNDKNIKDVAVTASKIARIIETNDKLCFNVSVGVNCGQVISGYLGVGEKRDFTIIGDPVNVTARIESLAEKLNTNKCLISETIYKLIGKDKNAKLYGEVELKGKSQPMKVYQLS